MSDNKKLPKYYEQTYWAFMKFELSLWQFTPRTMYKRCKAKQFFIALILLSAKIKGYQIPAVLLCLCQTIWFLAEREAIAFVIYNTQIFIRKMPRANEICKGAKHSNTNARQFHETKRSLKEKIRNLELREKIEYDEKNFAYSFILSKGYYHEFAEYHRKNHGKNGYGMCLGSILSLI